MNERKPTWNCPVCERKALYDTLMIDGYFQVGISKTWFWTLTLCSSDLAGSIGVFRVAKGRKWNSSGTRWHLETRPKEWRENQTTLFFTSHCFIRAVCPHGQWQIQRRHGTRWIHICFIFIIQLLFVLLGRMHWSEWWWWWWCSASSTQSPPSSLSTRGRWSDGSASLTSTPSSPSVGDRVHRLGLKMKITNVQLL